MNTFSIVRDALAKSEGDPSKVGLDERTVEAGRVIAAVQTVVDALTPPAGGRYVVAFADIDTAGTFLGDHRIVVSSKPLRDPDLTLVEKAVVIATFTAHEIGHTYITRPRKMPVNLVAEHNKHSGFQSVANIADDIILEPFMVERFPILQDAFAFTGMWVLKTTAKTPLPHRDTLHAGTSAAERFNIIMHATRYGDIPQIEWNDANVIAERDWARDWAVRLIASPLDDHAAFLALCDEVWERVRTVDETPEPEPEPEPEEDEDEDDGDQPGEGDEDGQPGESEDDDDDDGDEEGEGEGPGPGTDQGDDFDEDTDDEGEGDGEAEGDESDDGDGDSDDDGDGDGDGQPGPDSGDGEGEGEGDDGEDGESDGGTGSDGDSDGDTEDGDGESDERGDHPDYTGHDGDGDPGPDADGGGGNAEADKDSGTVRDEDDFDQSEVDETTHDSAEQTSVFDNGEEERVRTYDATSSVTFGQHGSITTTWE